jgi:hypothetical protein
MLRLLGTLLILVVSMSKQVLTQTTKTDTLNPGDRLAVGQSIFSTDGLFELTMERGDCLVIIYKNQPNPLPHIPLAFSRILGATNCHLEMQDGGYYNLVVIGTYVGKEGMVWASGPSHPVPPSKYKFVLLSKTGDLVLENENGQIVHNVQFSVRCPSIPCGKQ